MHELNGFELQNFLLERAGKTWDTVPVPEVRVSDLSKDALDAFRKKAVKSNRMTESEVNVSDELLLRNLKLFDGEYLTRAAILLFHPTPERYVTGSYIKIGYFSLVGTFGENAEPIEDLQYQDVVEAWGRGFLKIKAECKKVNAPLPLIDAENGGVSISASGCEKYISILRFGQYRQVGADGIWRNKEEVNKKNGDKKVTKKTQMQYDKILSFMEDGKEYGIWDFCKLLDLKESRTKVILQGLSDYIETFGSNRDRRYKKKRIRQ